ncbi:DNA-3-methyladenine glycosylase I [Cellulomonas shaoxiangyii]|uniref:DNA-3-methyladenine glycosylase I n=1 Tax=Cellulomonas shaoxiangyii TaxID=2566013 RepID=A0A4P7SGQ9_9CELL|nr:DNA-3-methyladenine glycosylase I [Cellulomonas shaoxiangyii]QCB92256.1 DNA-3-methyladenine glycosylase I [Cellulomonas shaoxiangyii]TGY85932.1 DNA-3-methyladenine glycosylase I [Cellulomonas shaoxiangyii]
MTPPTPDAPTAAHADRPLVAGRCFGDGDPLYAAYHDDEWGVPVHDEHALYERLALEAFQSGLAWITILRKRPAFRAAFAGFDPEVVARFDESDVARLLADAAIVRNRAKIEATVANARATLALHAAGRTLDEVLWSHAPTGPRPRATTWTDVPGRTPESAALARELRALGFRFVGPTTAYAAMQACGVVDDHLATCPVVASRARSGGGDRTAADGTAPGHDAAPAG